MPVPINESGQGIPNPSPDLVCILLADRFLFHEAVPPLRWTGVFFIMLGIVLVAQTGSA